MLCDVELHGEYPARNGDSGDRLSGFLYVKT